MKDRKRTLRPLELWNSGAIEKWLSALCFLGVVMLRRLWYLRRMRRQAWCLIRGTGGGIDGGSRPPLSCFWRAGGCR